MPRGIISHPQPCTYCIRGQYVPRPDGTVKVNLISPAQFRVNGGLLLCFGHVLLYKQKVGAIHSIIPVMPVPDRWKDDVDQAPDHSIPAQPRIIRITE